jgi:hypothetical protein
LETFIQNFPLLETNGYYWKVFVRLLEKWLIVDIFGAKKMATIGKFLLKTSQ